MHPKMGLRQSVGKGGYEDDGQTHNGQPVWSYAFAWNRIVVSFTCRIWLMTYERAIVSNSSTSIPIIVDLDVLSCAKPGWCRPLQSTWYTLRYPLVMRLTVRCLRLRAKTQGTRGSCFLEWREDLFRSKSSGDIYTDSLAWEVNWTNH